VSQIYQGGCQSSLQVSTSGHAWKCACIYSDTMKRENPTFIELSQAMKHECTTMNLQGNVKTWSGNTLSWQSDVDTVLGL